MDTIENVSAEFSQDSLSRAQARTWTVLHELSQRISDGMTEADAHAVAKTLFKDFEVEKVWHPSKIRFAENTLKTFRETSDPQVKIKDGDPFYLDLGLVFFNHEGDCGQTFVLGKNAEAEKMIQAGRDVFSEVRTHWGHHSISGSALYQFAEESAKKHGYELNLQGASGHRIGDFPHAIHHKGSLKALDRKPIADRWILEIQLKHPTLPMGAFYEDLLR